MNVQRVEVYCDDGFHEGERPSIRTFTRVDGEWLAASPEDDLIDREDKPYFRADASLADLQEAETRDRRRIECQCGAALIMRAERIEPLLDRLADGGAATISLARLNAVVSRQA